MVFLLLLLSTEPAKVLNLPGEFKTVRTADFLVYLAPGFGKSIFQLDTHSIDAETVDLQPVIFTDDENNRIDGFEITPFALYLNNGKVLDKFFFVSGVKESIYESRDISSFAVMPTEEIILADYKSNELIFLDSKNEVKFRISNQEIIDLKCGNGLVYGLTGKKIVMFDEYGNITDETALPEKMQHLYVDSALLYAYSNVKDYLYIYRSNNWEKVDLQVMVSDIAAIGSSLVILDNAGTHLYFYNRSAF